SGQQSDRATEQQKTNIQMFHVEQWRTSKVIHRLKKMHSICHSKHSIYHSWTRSTRALPFILMKRMKGKFEKPNN
ncbi:hypothetical protein, partial [Thiolapillus sp.]|uniref:hypothetical protein n=1 Tax=Thiolapillus sp. TaxID=2017437 RepID=UPI003AF48921